MKKKDADFSFKSQNEKTIKRIEGDLVKVDNALSYNADEKTIFSYLIDFSYQINILYKSVFKDMSSQLIGDTIISANDFNPVSCDVIKEGDVIKIRYNSLPAKRTVKISDSNKFATEFFRLALDKAVKESGIHHLYDTKVVIIYNIYYKEKKAADFDNYDFKNITDSICAYFLIDDSPYYISQYFTGEPSDREPYFEITIVPEEQKHLYI